MKELEIYEPTNTNPDWQIEVPGSYTIDNQLIVIVVQNFLHSNMIFENFTEQEVEEKRKELANLLLLKLKLPIFKVELTFVDNMLQGRVESTGNKPITFELKNTAKTF